MDRWAQLEPKLLEALDDFHNFPAKEVIGKGHFACVYKVTIDLGNRKNRVYAVKTNTDPIHLRTPGGCKTFLSYWNEISRSPSAVHTNIIQYLGFRAIPALSAKAQRQTASLLERHALTPREKVVAIKDLCVALSNEVRKPLRMFIVMEYFPGSNLRELIEEHRSAVDLGFDLFKQIMLQSLCALRFLHDRNMVHNDVKPHNILVSEDGIVKLCDFGGVCVIDRQPMSFSHTPRYLAPERKKLSINGKFSVNPGSAKSDVFSLGVTLTTLLDVVERTEDFCYCVSAVGFEKLTVRRILSRMTTECVESRPDIVQLYEDYPSFFDGLKYLQPKLDFRARKVCDYYRNRDDSFITTAATTA